jgi:DNA-binding CsgD family transcriptional regulator
MVERGIDLQLAPIEDGIPLEIVRNLVSGKTHAQIAEELDITVYEVRGYLAQIKERFEIEDRDGLVMAVRAGFENGQISADFDKEKVVALLSAPGYWDIWKQTVAGFNARIIACNLGIGQGEVSKIQGKINAKLGTTRPGAVAVGLRVMQILDSAGYRSGQMA